jgi:hypothetical protein
MRIRAALVVTLAVVLVGSFAELGARAQEEIEPAVPGTDEPAPAPEPPPEEPTARRNGLYVAVGYGSGSAEPFNTSLLTDAGHFASTTFDINETTNGLFAVGWKLEEGKGDFRLVVDGHSEDGYEFDSVGAWNGLSGGTVSSGCDLTSLTDAFSSGKIGAGEINASPGFVISPLGGQCLYGWWDVSIRDGHLRSVRTPGDWTQADDDNVVGDLGYQVADPGEIRYLDPDRTIETDVPDNLNNNILTWNALYGREFGGRRFSSRWWAGLRYFEYTGEALAAGWLNAVDSTGGTGFTDHVFLRLIGLAQETSGWGPTGSWEADFNFFNKGLVFFVRGDVAFTFNSLEVDSGNIFALLPTVGGVGPTKAAPVRIHESREKSSWQVAAVVGARVRLADGFEFELGYTDRGYLDTALFPSQMTIPILPGQVVPNDPEGTMSALYASQDVEITYWHALVGFQF